MTLGAIGAARVPCPAWQSFGPGVRRHVGMPEYRHLSRLNGSDESRRSLPEPGELAEGLSSRSELAVRAASRTWLRQTDGGQIDLKSKSWLEFNYEFESEDGTRVTLRARAKTEISYHREADGSYALKARVKLQIAAVRESVESGLEPLFGSDGTTELGTAVSSALDGFREAIDGLTRRFIDDAISGDDLIPGMVDAFNALAELVQTLAFGDKRSSAISAGESDAVLSDAAIPAAVPAHEPAASADTEAVDDEPVGEVAELPAEQRPAADPADVGGAEEVESAEDEPRSLPETSETETRVETPGATSATLRQSLLLDLRLRFVQSMSQLVATFDPSAEAADLVGTSVRSRLDLRLAAYSRTQAWLENVPRPALDAEV